jgi:hypothetical protein
MLAAAIPMLKASSNTATLIALVSIRVRSCQNFLPLRTWNGILAAFLQDFLKDRRRFAISGV